MRFGGRAVSGEFDVDGTGDVAVAVFARCSRIDKGDVRVVEVRFDLVQGGDCRFVGCADVGLRRGVGGRGAGFHVAAGGGPGRKAAVEDADVGVIELDEDPPEAGG